MNESRNVIELRGGCLENPYMSLGIFMTFKVSRYDL